MKHKVVISNILLITFMLLEQLCMYYFFKQGILSQGKNAILLFLSSILFGIAILYKFYNAAYEKQTERSRGQKMLSLLMPAVFIAGVVIVGFQYDIFFKKQNNPALSSDIIPVIQIMCKRLLAGTYPYAINTSYGFVQHLGYLPFHWMPFTMAELAHIDYRWISYIIWGIAGLWLCIRSMRSGNTALKIAIPFILIGANYALFSCNPGTIEATVELMIAAYYMMLITGLASPNAILQGVVISFCLLSRFSLVLWLPLYAFTLMASGNKKQLLVSVITVTIITLVIFVIPFLSKDWSILSNYKYYDMAARYEWEHLNKEGKPWHLWSGTGYAYFFYSRFEHLEIPARIKLLQRAHIVCCLLATMIMGAWYWINRARMKYRIFLIASFKIYLAVFLFLIQVPYEYLMCVGNFVTVAIFCEQAGFKLKSRTADQ